MKGDNGHLIRNEKIKEVGFIIYRNLQRRRFMCLLKYLRGRIFGLMFWTILAALFLPEPYRALFFAFSEAMLWCFARAFAMA